MTALSELIEAVESGGHPDFGAVWKPGTQEHLHACHAYYAEKWQALGHAYALHEALLPEWDATISFGGAHVSLSQQIGVNSIAWTDGPEAEADTPARAWLLAILKALAAQEAQP